MLHYKNYLLFFYLRLIPNLIIAAPINAIEFQNLLYTAQLGLNLPIAIRYPRGRVQTSIENEQVLINYDINSFNKLEIGKGIQISYGTDMAILTIGTIGNTIINICEEKQYANKIAHYNMRFVKPLDKELLHKICTNFTKIITIEDGVIAGGFGSVILEFIQENNYKNIKIKRLGIPDNFVEHGSISELKQLAGLDSNSIKKEIDKM